MAARNNNRRVLPRNCQRCGVTFTPRQSRFKCCSKSCATAHRYGPLSERFWRKVNKGGDDECWVWTGAVTKAGYGQITGGGKFTVHRLSWVFRHGPIKDGLWVLHRCDVPLCVNPNHLFLGTSVDNIRDMTNKGRAAHGEAHHWAKLSAADVIAIRASTLTAKKLSARYGICIEQVSNIRRRKQWRRV